MLHYDYTWDLYPNYMVLDPELKVERLGWKEGDYFQLVESNGKKILRKLDPLTRFVVEGKQVNE